MNYSFFRKAANQIDRLRGGSRTISIARYHPELASAKGSSGSLAVLSRESAIGRFLPVGDRLESARSCQSIRYEMATGSTPNQGRSAAFSQSVTPFTPSESKVSCISTTLLSIKPSSDSSSSSASAKSLVISWVRLFSWS